MTSADPGRQDELTRAAIDQLETAMRSVALRSATRRGI
jgi:hypothetical protein